MATCHAEKAANDHGDGKTRCRSENRHNTKTQPDIGIFVASSGAPRKRLFDAAETAFGAVGVLVNNAGIMELAPVAESDDVLFDRQIATNLKGVFNGLHKAEKRLHEGGRIINMSSSVVALRPPRYAVYAATKAGG